MSLTQGKGEAALHRMLPPLPRSGLAWNEIAQAIDLAQKEAPDESSSIKAAAARATLYSEPQINRFVITHERIKRISESGGPAVGDMIVPAFNTVEAAVKLYELDREKGLEAFSRLKKGDLTLTAVRSELTDAKMRAATQDPAKSPPHSAGVKLLSKDVRRRRQMSVVEALQRGWEAVSGQYEEIAWHEKDSFLEAEGIYRITRARSFGPSEMQHFGLETIVTAAERGPHFVDTILPASIVRARCFQQYFLAFWSHEPTAQIEHAAMLLNALNEDTIGIVSVGLDGRVKPRREAKKYNNPDDVAVRQEMFSLIVKQGRLKSVERWDADRRFTRSHRFT